jgi:hypothetical protein
MENIGKAAEIVCRNPDHLDQIISILKNSLDSCESSRDITVDKIVEHWWEKQLFLSIQLN